MAIKKISDHLFEANREINLEMEQKWDQPNRGSMNKQEDLYWILFLVS